MKNEKLKTKEVAAANSLPCYAAEVIAALEKEKKYSAAHNYRSAVRSVLQFAGDGGAPLPMNEKGDAPLPMSEVFTPELDEVFTPEWLKAYEEWLTAHEYSPNTVSTYMRALQAVYRRRVPPGTEGYNPLLFKDVYTKVEARTKRALTVAQMKKLEETDIASLTPEQQPVLAYFLLMFMLRGMPFIDLAHLRKSDLRDGRIIYRRHKTGRLMVVDVPPEAMRLIQKYRDRSGSGYLFPLLEERQQKNGCPTDGNLPDAEAQHRCYQKVLRRYNRLLERLMKQLLPGVPVSSYTARHTWATIAYHSGTPVGLISQSLGHSSIQVTMTYLKPFDAEVIDKVNRQVIALVKNCKKKKKGRRDMLYGSMLW